MFVKEQNKFGDKNMLKVHPRRLVIKRPSVASAVTSGIAQASTQVSAQALAQVAAQVLSSEPSDEAGSFKPEYIKIRLDLLEKICSSAGSVRQKMPVIANFNEMTRYALNASASSVILINQNKNELGQYTDSPLGKEVKQWPISARQDMIRWMTENKEPSIVNDIDKNDSISLLLRDEVKGLASRTIAFVPLLVNGNIIGVIKALNKLDGNNFNKSDLETLKGIANNIVSTLGNIRANETMLYSFKDNVKKMVSLLDPKENAASRNGMRVAEYALLCATELALSDEIKHNLAYAGILHDIGMLSIPGSIVNKTAPLTREELNVIRKHPVIGFNLLQGIPSLSEISNLVLYHHERVDGKGYPCGLKGNLIPLGARILAVADAFTSMTEKRLYRSTVFAKDALEELNKCVGSQFCPVAAKAFIVGYLKSHGMKATVKKANPA
jgi:HD-GYP domain-containing protein (c-di-GMP phosphodiesterase class II)